MLRILRMPRSITALSLPLFLWASAGAATAQPVQFRAGDTVTILTTDDMRTNGLMFPDLPLSFVKGSRAGRYLIFGAGGSSRNIGPGPRVVPYGTYKFIGTLDHFEPAKTEGNWPAFSLTLGQAQPSPDGREFDRDYGGGGPVYPLQGSSALVELYHGEYHCSRSGPFPAYGAIGMAVSKDRGDSFAKIGEVLSPHISEYDACASGRRAGFWSDGSMIEADANGNRSGSAETYEYILFVEHNSVDEPFNGVSIARAPKAEVFHAIGEGQTPLFKKYYNPTGATGPVGNMFTEPAIGGRSTNIIAGEHRFINSPSIYYDSALNKFVICYQVNQKSIVLQVADNLFRWSDPTSVVVLGQGDLRLFYPSLVGLGVDPKIPGKSFFLFYLTRDVSMGNPQLLRVQISARLGIDP